MSKIGLRLALILLGMVLAIPAIAQDSNNRSIAFEELVSGVFDMSDPATPQFWTFQAEGGDVISIEVLRTGGVFTPRIALVGVDGIEIQPQYVELDDYRHLLFFQEGLESSGSYQVRVSQDNPQPNTALTRNEYSLYIDYRGTTDVADQFQEVMPQVTPNPLPPFFETTPDESSFAGIALYGDITVTEGEDETQGAQLELAGQRSLSVDNTNAITRVIQQIAFTDTQIALGTASGTIFVTDENITSLSIAGSTITIILESSTTIVTDFFAMESIVHLHDLTEIIYQNGNRMVLDDDTVSILRRGGINGEGPNAEPVVVVEAGDHRFQTDLQGWQVLSLVGNNILLSYDSWQFSSVMPSGNYFQDTPPQFIAGRTISEGDNFYEITTGTGDDAQAFVIDPFGLLSVGVQAGQVHVIYTDGHNYEHDLSDLSATRIENQITQFAHVDGTTTTILRDDTRIETATPPAILPQNFNNLGTTVSDYHPRVDFDFALKPVNRINGNFVYPVTDYEVRGSAFDLLWQRTYNSRESQSAPPAYFAGALVSASIGQQWRHTYQIELDVRNRLAGNVTLILADGSSHRFTNTSTDSNRYQSRSLRSWTIEYSGGLGGSWVAHNLEGMQYYFDTAGRLESISDHLGRHLIFAQMSPDYVAQSQSLLEEAAYGGFFVLEPYGRRFEVYTDINNQIIAIRGVQGRLIRYRHDGGDLLTSVDYPGIAYAASYDYENSLLVGINDVNSPYEPEMALQYDDDGRVLTYSYYPQSGQPESYDLTYGDDQTTQSWLVEGGHNTDNIPASREMIFAYDDNSRLTSWVLADEQWQYEWVYGGETDQLVEIIQPARTRLRFNYDERGYLTRFADPQFTETGAYTFRYNDSQNNPSAVRMLTAISTPDIAQWITYTYDENLRLSQISQAISTTNEARRTTSFAYNDNHQLERITKRLSETLAQITLYSYDLSGYPDLIELGGLDSDDSFVVQRRWELRHDGVGRLLRLDDEDNIVTSITWQPDRNLIEAIETRSRRFEYRYDTFDNLVYIDTPQYTETYTYDSHNRMATRTGRSDDETGYVYDSAGNLVTIILPDGSEEQYSYGLLDNLISHTRGDNVTTRYDLHLDEERYPVRHTITNPLGEQLAFRFDSLGRIRQVTDLNRAGDEVFRYNLNYGSAGNLIDISDAGGRNLALAYNQAGDVLSSSISIAPRIQTRYTYNFAGLLQSVTTPLGLATNYTYDIAGLPVSVEQAGILQFFEYDPDGKLTTVADPSGNVATYTYTDQMQLSAVRDVSGNFTQYEYDNAGNLVSVDDARASDDLVTYEYDLSNRLVAIVDAGGGRTEYDYDQRGNLISVTEPSRLQTNFAFDETNNIVAITQPNDREFLYSHDVLGRVISETNPLGQTTSFSYNVIGELSRITDPNGVVEAFSWYSDGVLSRYSLSNGTEFEYIPDQIGRLTEIIDLGSNEATAVNTRIVYDDGGQIVSIIRGNRLSIANGTASIYRYQYDDLGRVTSVLEPGADTPTQLDYDTAGNVIQITSADGIQTTYTHDASGRVLSQTENVGTPREHTTQYAYDAAGNLLRVSKASGLTITYAYDANQRLVSIVESAQSLTQREHTFAYDEAGQLTSYQNPSGTITSYGYDLFGNLVSVEQNGTITRYTYDAIDNLTGIALPEGQLTNLTYDGSGRRVRYVDARNQTWAYSYDEVGNLSQISDPLGNNQTFNFDLSNRLRSIIFPNKGQVDFQFDSLGNLSRVTLPGDNPQSRETTSYGFDRAGNLIAYTSGDNQYRFERDNSANLESITTPGNEQINILYDEARFITSIASDDFATNRLYDDAGRITSLENDQSTISIEYDSFGLPVSYEGRDTDSLESIGASYNYDATGRIVSRDAGQLGQINYQYDESGQPVTIALNDQSLRITYNQNGWRSTIDRSNGVTTRYTYDENGLVRNVVHLDRDDTIIDAFAYEYDEVGNVIRVTRGDNWAILYSYDAAQQLTSERWLDDDNRTVYSATYAYDVAGNRIEQAILDANGNQSRTEFSYNIRNQLVSETRNAPIDIDDRFSLPVTIALLIIAPVFAVMRRRRLAIIMVLLVFPLVVAGQFDTALVVDYTYDHRGNLIEEIFDEQGRIVYTYDIWNRLTKIEERGQDNTVNKTTSITYDAAGRVASIISEAENSETANFDLIYDLYGLVAIEDNLTGDVDVHLSPAQNETALVVSNGQPLWVLDDGLGRFRRFVGQDAIVINNEDRFNLNAFGGVEIPFQTGTNIPSANFLEQIYLDDAGIMLEGVRAYHVRTGRFMQRDWVRHDPYGSLYIYANNNPHKYITPAGLSVESANDPIQPSIPVLDTTSTIVQHVIPEARNQASVAQYQARENARLLELGITTQFELNDIVLQPELDGCDIYIQVANPMPDASQQLAEAGRRQMLARYSPENGWLPVNRPAPGTARHLLDDFKLVSQLRGQAIARSSAPVDCAGSLVTGQRPNPQPLAFYEALQGLREQLDETPFYDVTFAEIGTLTTLLEEQSLAPVMRHVNIEPEIEPEPGGMLSELQNQSHMMFDNLLLPLENQQTIQWQVLAQAQPVAPAPILSIENED